MDFFYIMATNVDTVIKGVANNTTGFHTFGLIIIVNMPVIDFGEMVELKHSDANKYAYNGSKLTNNRGWLLKLVGLIAKQLEGLVYSENLMHSGTNIPTRENHLKVNNGV
ncbi:hypothetical protein HF650_06535 [Kosakonia sp. SMBL-WEM22]|uniref:hypothetical protein n=1 Tax=Kosakonia sp. SMBL-WEM22 TaxID=2725560 RepID=UPI0016590336|nr:hypothetical protein [Kosakonia sp. SMBL-WEM22]QNQ19439.1 hypothetical protein HF650_06535 [Kosakonia sp. SMBL-WEM22]